jgi:hypothetical protein
VAAKLGWFVGGILAVVLLAGVFGGEKGVQDFGSFLSDAVHWIGHWLGNLGHWIGETWKSYFGENKK